MSQRIDKAGLQVDAELVDFIEARALPGTGVDAEAFWTGFSGLVHQMGPKNRDFLAKREELQGQIDDWHRARAGQPHDAAAYTAFLKEIGYLVPEGPDFEIETANVDPEIAHVPGPQLVVPITNARFALNAANARWGSLYDAYYGTDALGDLPKGGGYDAERGARVVAAAKAFVDGAAPMATGSHSDLLGYKVVDGALHGVGAAGAVALADPAQFAGYTGAADAPTAVLLKNNGLHIEIRIDDSHAIGKTDPAHVSDIVVESALSTIMDCEDSVAAVDAEDKVVAYGNWLGLMKGDLSETFEKGSQQMTRVMNPDRTYTAPDGSELTLKGRSLMLIRNVGHLMTNPAVLDRDGLEVGEGLMDAMITTLIAMHDLSRAGGNSVTGSVYVVKPKMHGPAEVAFADEIFTAVEAALGLPAHTVKLGIMDEERRTSANLK
ncbi:MAG: malate synthase G, partial [Sulfitobacter sp.]|nr:malate synthase G [Sulfitobacter sp.]